MGVNVHCGAHIGMSEKFLHVLGGSASGEQVAGVCVAELVEMEVVHILQLLLCRPAHGADGAGGFIGPIGPQAYKRDFVVALRGLLRPGQGVKLVIGAVLLLDDQIVILAVQRPILEAAFELFLLGRPQDGGEGVAEVHRADFLALGRPDLHLVPGGVVAHTAAHRQTLFLQVNVLPCQSTRLADAQARKVRDLDREQGRVFFSFEKVNQQLILPIGNHRDWVFLAAIVRE